MLCGSLADCEYLFLVSYTKKVNDERDNNHYSHIAYLIPHGIASIYRMCIIGSHFIIYKIVMFIIYF